MVGRFTHRSTMSRLMVWQMLIAFSICLFASTAFSRQRPYDIKTVTHVVKETDDGGWAGGGSMYQGRPLNQQDSSSILVRWFLKIVRWQPKEMKTEPKHQEPGTNVDTGTSSAE